jgi:hypothetical protein
MTTYEYFCGKLHAIKYPHMWSALVSGVCLNYPRFPISHAVSQIGKEIPGCGDWAGCGDAFAPPPRLAPAAVLLAALLTEYCSGGTLEVTVDPDLPGVG